MWVKFKFKVILIRVKKRYLYIFSVLIHQIIQQSISSPLTGEDEGGGDPPPLNPLPPGEGNRRLPDMFNFKFKLILMEQKTYVNNFFVYF